MKPLQGDQQLQAVSLAYSVALQALKPKSLSTKNKALDASTHRGLTESSGEVFLLDILSHRMSVMAMFRQLTPSHCLLTLGHETLRTRGAVHTAKNQPLFGTDAQQARR